MRYEKYKDSGIEWIGEIPEHWVCERVKNYFKSYKLIVGENSTKYQRLALTMQGVLIRDKMDNNGLQPLNFEGYQLCKKGDIIFKLIDLANISTSRVGLSPYEGIVSPAYILLRRDCLSMSIEYSYYYFYSLWKQNVFNGLGTDGVRSSLNKNDLLNLPIPKPSIEEQEKIASYLDEKTEKIDSIIKSLEEQKDKLELYKRELIAEVVTKGLNKNVPMKDSGVDWIGEVPEHWKVEKIKWNFEIVKRQDGREERPVLSITQQGIKIKDIEKKRWSNGRVI